MALINYRHLDGIAYIVFYKKGFKTLRYMTCTQNLKYVPREHWPPGPPIIFPVHVARIFDLDIQQWRSFLKANIVSIIPIK
jgi:hypothetical protein